MIWLFTRYKSDFRNKDPLRSKKELNHDVLAVLLLQVDADVPGVLDGQVRHIPELNRPVVTKFVLLKQKNNNFILWNFL